MELFPCGLGLQMRAFVLLKLEKCILLVDIFIYSLFFSLVSCALVLCVLPMRHFGNITGTFFYIKE